jgi:SagB-type dehydrogenase family enzyme
MEAGLVSRDFAGIAQVDVIGAGYRACAEQLPRGASFRLSRFAYLRQRDGVAVLESPLALVSVTFADWRGPAILGLISSPQTMAQIEWPPGTEPDRAASIVQMLYTEGFLELRVGADETPESSKWLAPQRADGEQQALREWSFHDLLFHSRSRLGTHGNPTGTTYRFAAEREPLPAVKPRGGGAFCDLPKPDLASLRRIDVPFTEVVESRRSIRSAGPEPLTVEQLGEFLYRSAPVRELLATDHGQLSRRPYPGGGAQYELEIYPLVNRVTGLDHGLYHYDPLDHGLEKLAVNAKAMGAVGSSQGRPPDVMLLITARIMRLTFKYESIPYSLALKDLGVLMQTFYLTGTAMGLATCAMGGGSSEAFAGVAGISPILEPQIGEFWLNSGPLMTPPLHEDSESETVEP